MYYELYRCLSDTLTHQLKRWTNKLPLIKPAFRRTSIDKSCRSWMSLTWNQKVCNHSLFFGQKCVNVAGVADQFKGWPKIPILHKLQPIKRAVTSSISNLFVTTRYPRAINWCLGSDGTIKRSNTGFLKVNPKTYWASLCAIWHPVRDKPPKWHFAVFSGVAATAKPYMSDILQCFLLFRLITHSYRATVMYTSAFGNFAENRTFVQFTHFNLTFSPPLISFTGCCVSH